MLSKISAKNIRAKLANVIEITKEKDNKIQQNKIKLAKFYFCVSLHKIGMSCLHTAVSSRKTISSFLLSQDTPIEQQSRRQSPRCDKVNYFCIDVLEKETC